MPIKVLSEQLASQIAAGEVIERPASAVKELIENAIDAGAHTINIDIQQGGRKAIQIADDGKGIPADEVEIAFRRHATSKLSSADQLEAIATLGFRGEALAAIAAVSQTTIVTRAVGETSGTRIQMNGGHVSSRDQVGAPQGTVISIENLFFNIPARLKFLKTIATEKRLIDEFITKIAMAYPDIRFRLVHDNRISFQTTGSGNLRDVLVSVYGAEIARDLLPIERTDQSQDENIEEKDEPADEANLSRITVNGYAAPPSIHRANRNHITLFINGRWIKDKNITYAAVQAYHTLLPIGRYPLAVVFVTMPLNEVDVNVHPTKTEVRFTNPSQIFGKVQKAIRQTIIADTPVRSIRSGHFESLTQPSGWEGYPNRAFSHADGDKSWEYALRHPKEQTQFDPDGVQQGQMGLGLPRYPGEPVRLPISAADEDQNDQLNSPHSNDLAGEKLPIMRVIGQVGSSYIITEGPEGMFLIDQHAAHERIQYENFMEAHARQEIPSQGLVAGAAVHLSPDQATLLESQIPSLTSLGFQIEPFGPGAYMVRAVPAVVAHQDPTRVVLDIIADLERGDTPMQQKVEDKIIRRVCKTASIKAGQTLSRQEMEALIQQLEQCQNPHTCPHGRPTLIFLSVSQLAREFGRP
ncbi:MAG: DNA mismatch repair protein MutL [Cellvibrionaceae bacterium]|jgi:DNA mismatch repair protein MutL